MTEAEGAHAAVVDALKMTFALDLSSRSIRSSPRLTAANNRLQPTAAGAFIGRRG
jgi:hypothetical protein